MLLLLTSVLMATQCDSDECFDQNCVYEENLISLIPLLNTYDKGDQLTLKINIPSTNSYFGNEVDLFESTADNSASLVLYSDTIFTDNTLTFIKGSQGEYPNWFNLPYNSQTEMYELEVKIVLNKIGDYMHFNGGDIDFIESAGRCSDYLISTNILWLQQGDIEFMVVE